MPVTEIEINRLRHGPVVYEPLFTPAYLNENLEEGVRFEEARGEITFKLVGEEALAEGELHSTVHVPCARCLGRVSRPVRCDIHLYFWPAGKAAQVLDEETGDIEIDLDEPDCAYYHKGIIKPDNDLRELLVLEIPDFEYCSEDCKGLCITCGANLNETTCSCSDDDEDEDEDDDDGGTEALWKQQLKKMILPPE